MGQAARRRPRTLAALPLGRRSLCERFEREVGYGLKDRVVRDEWDPESDRGRRDPAVGGVLALRESVADRGAVGAQLGADRHELGAGVDNLRALDLAVE